MKEKRKFSVKRFAKRLGFVAAGIYISICALLFFFQEKLLFHPRPFTQKHADSLTKTLEQKFAEQLIYKMGDGKNVSGWFVHDNSQKCSADKKPLIIYYPGNAEEVSPLISKKDSVDGFHVALLNYRGYGTSEGEPSEEKFFSDALEIFDMMKKRNDVDTNNIFVIGRSIGTGVASYVTKNRRVKGCILITPYDCMSALAAERYPAFPVKFLLKHQFNSVDGAEKIKTPVLCYIASDDEIIPPLHAYRLMLKWKGEKFIKVFDGSGHNNIMQGTNYWKGISVFMHRMMSVKD